MNFTGFVRLSSTLTFYFKVTHLKLKVVFNVINTILVLDWPRSQAIDIVTIWRLVSSSKNVEAEAKCFCVKSPVSELLSATPIFIK